MADEETKVAGDATPDEAGEDTADEANEASDEAAE